MFQIGVVVEDVDGGSNQARKTQDTSSSAFYNVTQKRLLRIKLVRCMESQLTWVFCEFIKMYAKCLDTRDKRYSYPLILGGVC